MSAIIQTDSSTPINVQSQKRFFKMNRLNRKLSISVATIIIVYGIFFACQINFAQFINKSQEVKADSTNKQEVPMYNNKTIQSLELKVEAMEKYVNIGQKNLDLWLKLLAFILTLLIGFSVYSGLKSRELAKEELDEIRRIKENITREANDAEDRLKEVKKQLLEIENTAASTKKIEGELTQKLKEFAVKENIALSEAQKKTLDETISKTREELKKTGIESLKNLFYAKGLKAKNDENYEDVVRLMTFYIDLDETNHYAFRTRGFAYAALALESKKDEKRKAFAEKAIKDFDDLVRLRSDEAFGYAFRGLTYKIIDDNNNALKDYNEAIRIDPTVAAYYEQRRKVFNSLKRTVEAESDLAKYNELKNKETS